MSGKRFLPLLCCSVAWGQTAANKGLILQPSGDATLTNIMVGSAVTPSGAFGYTAEVYLVKTDGSAPPRKLTSFDESNQAPGATSVAISPDGTRAAYVGRLDTNGIRHEEVHAIDIASGTDRLITTNQNMCGLPSCFGPITFSQDGSKLLWGYSLNTNSIGNTIYKSNFDGSAVTQLGFQQATISGPNNVTANTGRFIFRSNACGDFCVQAETANLDGSGATVLATSSDDVYPGSGGFFDEVISASGNVTAQVAYSYSPDGNSVFVFPEVTPGTCTAPSAPYNVTSGLGSMTISNDGSHVAYVQSTGQILNCESAVTPLNVLNALDVELSADGTRMIFSAGPGNGTRAAIWISDASGANRRPVFAPRSINASGIVGLGSYPTNILPMSPGSYFTIYGTNFVDADALATPANLPLPLSLAGVSVQVNGTAVPVEAVTPWQINALLPQDVAPGSVTVMVHLPDGTSLDQAASVARTAAAIDLIPGFVLQAAAFHPGTAILADLNHPAAAGEILETYGFGLGPTTPDVAAGAGAPSNPLANAAMPFVNIDGVLAQTTFAGLVPGLTGLYQVNVVVPAGLAPGVHHTHWYTTDPAAGPEGVIYTQ